MNNRISKTMEGKMDILQRRSGNIVILDMHGAISLGESREKFARVMEDLFQEKDRNVLVNFSGINYVDSTGIGELVGYLNKFIENNRQLKLLRPHDRIRKLLEITKLDTMFQIYYDEEEALKSFTKG
jgi:anti-sigma B factor antagonist